MNYKNLLLLLFQNGGELYTKDAKATLLDSPTAVDAFSFMTSLYTDYGLYKEYNFLNQFRAGSVPIGISDYSLYNQRRFLLPSWKGSGISHPFPELFERMVQSIGRSRARSTPV